MDELDDSISLLYIRLAIADGTTNTSELKHQLAQLKQERVRQQKNESISNPPSSVSTSHTEHVVTESLVRHAVDEAEDDVEQEEEEEEEEEEREDEEEKAIDQIATPGAKKAMEREQMTAIMRGEAEKCFGNAADREAKYNLHEFRHNFIHIAHNLALSKEIPVMYANATQRLAWFDSRAYRFDEHVLSFEPKRIGSVDSCVDDIKAASRGTRDESRDRYCPNWQLCDVRRAHFGLHGMKRPAWNPPVGHARQSDINTLLVDFECMLDDEIMWRLRERDLVRLRNLIRDKIATLTHDYASLLLFVKLTTESSIEVTVVFAIPKHPIQHIFHLYQRCATKVADRFPNQACDDDECYSLQPLCFPLSSWFKPSPTLNACMGRYLHGTLDLTASVLRNPIRKIFSEEQWNYMVFQKHATITHRRTLSDPPKVSGKGEDDGGGGEEEEEEEKQSMIPKPSMVSSRFLFAPTLDDVRASLTRDMRPSEMAQWLRLLLGTQFGSNANEPFSIGVVDDVTWQLDDRVFETWMYQVDLQPLLGPDGGSASSSSSSSTDAIQRYACDRLLVVLRLLYATIRSAQAKHVPCGPWELFIRLTKFSQLTCTIAINRTNRLFAEDELRRNVFTQQNDKHNMVSTTPLDTLTMGGLEQVVTQWFQQTYTNPVVPVFWLLPDQLRVRFPSSIFGCQTQTVHLCRVAEILNDGHTVFTDAHVKLTRETIDDLMRQTHQPAALSLVFLQQPCDTIATLGKHWIILLQISVYMHIYTT